MSLESIKGIIFDIQRFSIHDGPGIRTTVFMKGCPLDCAWCHNPESKAGKPEIAYYPKKCIYCGACAALCPGRRHAVAPQAHSFGPQEHSFAREGCTRCGKCSKACPADALELIGREITAGEALCEVEKDIEFYRNSSGGMTLSGGEPFFQPEFAIALLAIAKRDGLHTCVETCGAAAFETLARAAEFTDMFLYDIKETDSLRHMAYTGVSNELIIKNLEKLDASELLGLRGAKIVLRCPIIPGINDNEAHFKSLCSLAGRLKNVDHIDIEPYHPLGISKAEAIGKPVRYSDASITPKERAAEWVGFMKAHSSIPVLIS